MSLSDKIFTSNDNTRALFVIGIKDVREFIKELKDYLDEMVKGCNQNDDYDIGYNTALHHTMKALDELAGEELI